MTRVTRVRWKLITVQLGGNDLCSYECGAEEGDARPAAYKGRNTAPSVHIVTLPVQRNMHTMLSILAQLPRTVVALLQPQDFTRYQLVRDRGLLCDLLLTNSCPCLFRGDTRRNTRRLRALLARYRSINTQLAKHFSAGDFAVEVLLLWISTISTISTISIISTIST